MSGERDQHPTPESSLPEDESERAARDFLHDLGRYLRGEELEGTPGEGTEPPQAAGTALGIPERLGSYEVLGRIGSGGMGAVYEARDSVLGRRVALKVIRRSQGTVERFEREARALAKLKHPAIVELYEFGEDKGLPFISMEYLDGEELGAVLQQKMAGTVASDRSTVIVREWGTPLPGEDSESVPPEIQEGDAEASEPRRLDGEWVRTVLEWMRDAARGLEHGHSLGVLHRDIKPSNLLVTREGKIKIMDFGLARDLKDVTVTRTGDFLGTPRYMSPEQLLTRRIGIDHRTDIYSLGVTLYELLAGEYPFPYESQRELYRKIALEEPEPLREKAPWVSRDLETVVMVAMAKHPGHRYQSAAAFAEDLDAVLEDRPIRARRPGLARRLRLQLRRSQGWLVPAAAGLLVAVVLVGLWASLHSSGIRFFSRTDPWVEAITSIANAEECPEYGGLKIGRQEGLLPIGRDPRSGLWEFAHLATGKPAERGPDGRLVLTPETGVVLVLLPGGTFFMGAQRREPGIPNQDPEASVNEAPVHDVTLSPFFISKYELRQEEWSRVQGASPSRSNGSSLPEAELSWNDCQDFCGRVGLQLPSEAQWEYACRAGGGKLFGGGTPLDDMAWYKNNSGARTHPVGEKHPNGFGLHDMHGNVWEWCVDGYDSKFYSHRSASGPDPVCTSGHALRVFRGGSVHSDSRDCRSSNRDWFIPDAHLGVRGMRPARPLGSKGKPADVRRISRPIPPRKLPSTKPKVPPSEPVVPPPDMEQRWRQAIASIADPSECPAYTGLAIKSQRDLYPLGRDPQSGLWEFAHLVTGKPATRGPDGKLVLTSQTGVVLVLLPGGTFFMGAQSEDPEGPNYDPAAREDEGPVHEVTVSPFFISKYELRQDEWARVRGANPSAYQGTGRPVESVSWNDCQSFCNSVGLQLPSEAQWEYACRAGTSGPFSGTGSVADMAWYISTSIDNSQPVGTKSPNDFGLHDVHGNVWEWCHDHYDSGFYSVPEAVGPDPVSTTGSEVRVYRGGGWLSGAWHCRASLRFSHKAEYSYDSLGLRPARSLEP